MEAHKEAGTDQGTRTWVATTAHTSGLLETDTQRWED